MDDFDLSESLAILDDRLINICKYRQEGCCKYIVLFEQANGFYCVKNIPELKSKVDGAEMTAQGDNCEGLKYETRSKPERAPH